jgi:hypothetical protein
MTAPFPSRLEKLGSDTFREQIASALGYAAQEIGAVALSYTCHFDEDRADTTSISPDGVWRVGEGKAEKLKFGAVNSEVMARLAVPALLAPEEAGRVIEAAIDKHATRHFEHSMRYEIAYFPHAVLIMSGGCGQLTREIFDISDGDITGTFAETLTLIFDKDASKHQLMTSLPDISQFVRAKIDEMEKYDSDFPEEIATADLRFDPAQDRL